MLRQQRANTHLFDNEPSHQDKGCGRKQPVVVDKDLQRKARADFAGISAAVGTRRVLSVGLVSVGGSVGVGDSAGGTQPTIPSPSSKHRRTGCVCASRIVRGSSIKQDPDPIDSTRDAGSRRNVRRMGGGKQDVSSSAGPQIFSQWRLIFLFFCLSWCAGPQKSTSNACFLQTLGSGGRTACCSLVLLLVHRGESEPADSRTAALRNGEETEMGFSTASGLAAPSWSAGERRRLLRLMMVLVSCSRIFREKVDPLSFSRGVVALEAPVERKNRTAVRHARSLKRQIYPAFAQQVRVCQAGRAAGFVGVAVAVAAAPAPSFCHWLVCSLYPSLMFYAQTPCAQRLRRPSMYIDYKHLVSFKVSVYSEEGWLARSRTRV